MTQMSKERDQAYWEAARYYYTNRQRISCYTIADERGLSRETLQARIDWLRLSR